VAERTSSGLVFGLTRFYPLVKHSELRPNDSSEVAVGEYAQVSRLDWLREAIPWPRRREPDVVPFAELVLAHYFRQLEVYQGGTYGGPQEELYQAKLKAFIATNGRIVESYWCTREPSGVAVTERRQRSWRRLWVAQSIVTFHSETDWVTAACPAVADQVYACRALAVKVGEVLRGTGELVAMQWLVTSVERLLGLVDQAERPVDDKLVKQVVAASQDSLREIRRYYDRAAANQARLVYFQGMMRGALLLAALVGLVAVGLYVADFAHWHSPVTHALFIATAMGGLGAIISVMSRMAGKGSFSADYEVGRKMVRRLGSLRPFIGAIFAVAIYFGLASRLIQIGTEKRTIYFYATVAFLAGFSERWATVMLDGAGITGGSGGGKGANRPS